jgi:hypothetical protein
MQTRPPVTDRADAVLALALAEAERSWGTRLVAAYALGSLAHGGFSIHVSDVDLGLVLADPLEAGDAEAVRSLVDRVKAGGGLLSDRLSVFWGSPATLAGRAQGGRFPPVDLLDLKEHGRLLAGTHVRDEVRAPTPAEMVVAAAQQALARFATDEATAQWRDPAPLVAAGVRALTKRVLFPVRYLYTARTGQIGRNEESVAHFLAAHAGPAADLARAALRWRHHSYDPADPAVLALATRGLIPLYRMFVEEYARHLHGLGEHELAQAFEQWRARLD